MYACKQWDMTQVQKSVSSRPILLAIHARATPTRLGSIAVRAPSRASKPHSQRMQPSPAAEASNSALGDVRGLLGLEDPPAQHPVACTRMGTISVRGC